MNKELMEALNILEKEKEISKRLFLRRLRILCLPHVRIILVRQITLRWKSIVKPVIFFAMQRRK